MNSIVKRSFLISALLLSFGAGVAAQQVYRIVGPDGRITFTDQPPPPSAPVRSAALAPVNAPAPGSVQMPLELREALERYPVTIFTGPNCEPCDAGRTLLARRGVPFQERTVISAEDGQALQRMASTNSLPLMTVGAQQVKGFSDLEWQQYLDAAGYPKASRLPPSYRQPAASPLVAAKAPSAPAQPTVEAAAATRPALVPAPSSPAESPPPPNPAGIKF